MSLPHPTPPLLLTKRLTAFLHANQTPQLPTLLLTTPHGKLLAHASPSPVSVLRTHATVAASLLAIHTSASAALPFALPGARTPDPIGSSPPEEEEEDDADDEGDGSALSSSGINPDDNDSASRPPRRPRTIKPVTLTVQLTRGTVVVRRLRCGLLFVCVGPAASDAEHHQHPNNHHEHHHHHGLHFGHHLHGENSQVGSPSEVDSMISAGGQTTTSLDSAGAAAVVAMRRHAADLARWLDDKLGTLTVPEEGVGVE